MKKQAFSLYETLITMAILGVVTALTLPSLMRMHQESSVGPMLSKVQTTIEDGVEKLILDDPYTALKDIEVVTKIQDFIIMKSTDGGYKLKDGVVLKFTKLSSETVLVSEAAGFELYDIDVDVNGSALPNQAGIDKFKFKLSSEGHLFPQGCAAVYADNNWKAPKDYDYTTCHNYKQFGEGS